LQDFEVGIEVRMEKDAGVKGLAYFIPD